MKIAVLASGRGSNLAAILAYIKEHKINGEVVLILSDKKDAYALEIAAQAGITGKFIDPEQYSHRRIYDMALAEEIRAIGGELVVLAGFMRMLSPAFLAAFPQRVLNIHPSLLPSFAGLQAQKQALDYGVKISGCTVHFVDSGMDSGPIIAQRAVPVLEGDTVEKLTARILWEEHQLYPQVIGDIIEGRIELKGNKVVYQKED